MKQILVILTIQLIALTREGLCAINPCPDVIKFHRDSSWNRYGIITIPPPGKGKTILEVEISINNDTHDGGKTSLGLRKDLYDVVSDAAKGKDIEYIYHFPQSGELPTIRRITLNHRDICIGPKDHYGTKFWNKHEFSNPIGATQLSSNPNDPQPDPSNASVSPPPISSPPALLNDSSWVESLPFADTCGRRSKSKNILTQLIIGGEDVTPGEFPWLVALFHYKENTVVPVCSASLISNKYVITAAHCTRGQKRVHLELGKHNISDLQEDGYIERTSRKIIEPTEYVVGGAHGDIALIEIDHVDFTKQIQPICLWAQGLDKSVPDGIVTSWGQVENNGVTSQTPMKLKVQTVGIEKCRTSESLLQNITTDKTFCAGGNSTGLCHGDSGSGFYMYVDEVWYLRGVISTSVGTNATCNPNKYAVYFDLTYFLDWMRPYLLS